MLFIIGNRDQDPHSRRLCALSRMPACDPILNFLETMAFSEATDHNHCEME